MASKPLSHYAPVFSLLFAATLWGVIWYPLRLLEQHGLHGLWSSLVSYGAALAVGAFYTRRQGDDWRRDPRELALMALASGWCNVAFILAVIDGAVVRVLLLFYLSPVWAVLLGRWLLGERVSRQGMLMIGVALLGGLIMLWDETLGMPLPQARADWLALSAGMTFALANVLVRRLHRVSIAVKTVSTWIGVLLVALLWIGVTGHALPDTSASAVLGAAALGVFGIMIMTTAVQYGVTHMPVHRSAVILLFELVAGAVSSQLLTDEIITPREMIGGALVVLAAYLAARQHSVE